MKDKLRQLMWDYFVEVISKPTLTENEVKHINGEIHKINDVMKLVAELWP